MNNPLIDILDKLIFLSIMTYYILPPSINTRHQNKTPPSEITFTTLSLFSPPKTSQPFIQPQSNYRVKIKTLRVVSVGICSSANFATPTTTTTITVLVRSEQPIVRERVPAVVIDAPRAPRQISNCRAQLSVCSLVKRITPRAALRL